MKKFMFIFLSCFAASSIFSQNYIGKNMNQIINEESFSWSQDSTEIWEKKDIYVDLRDFKKEKKIRIHDVSNFRVLTCSVENDTCTSFTLVYYNFSKKYVEKLLDKKYNYNGNETWICRCGKSNLQLCLEERPGKIFIIEACDLTAERVSKKAQGYITN